MPADVEAVAVAHFGARDPADVIALFDDTNRYVVAHELIGSRESRGTGADDKHGLAVCNSHVLASRKAWAGCGAPFACDEKKCSMMPQTKPRPPHKKYRPCQMIAKQRNGNPRFRRKKLYSRRLSQNIAITRKAATTPE